MTEHYNESFSQHLKLSILSDVVCMLLILFIRLQPSVAPRLFVISASMPCLLLDLCDCIFWLCFVFVLMFVPEVLEHMLDEVLDLCVGWGQHWVVWTLPVSQICWAGSWHLPAHTNTDAHMHRGREVPGRRPSCARLVTRSCEGLDLPSFHSSLWSVKIALSGKTSHQPHSFSLDSNNRRRPC